MSNFEFQVNTFKHSSQQFPSIGALVDGSFVVTWQSHGQDGDRNGIYGQRYESSGATVGNEFQINTYTANDQSFPSVSGLWNGGV